MNAYDETVVLDMQYLEDFLKTHGILKSEFTNSLGYAPQWFNKRVEMKGRCRWRTVKKILEDYAVDPKKLIREDPYGIFTSSSKPDAQLSQARADEILSAIQTLSDKVDILIKKGEGTNDSRINADRLYYKPPGQCADNAFDIGSSKRIEV